MNSFVYAVTMLLAQGPRGWALLAALVIGAAACAAMLASLVRHHLRQRGPRADPELPRRSLLADLAWSLVPLALVLAAAWPALREVLAI